MNSAQETLFELLATRATEGLSGSDSLTLERLLRQSPQLDPDCFDRAAAAVHLALLGPERPMPESLRRRLVTTGVRLLAPESRARTGAEPGLAPDRPDAATRGSLGWWAAAAALALAVAGWWPSVESKPPTTPEAGRTPAAAIESLVEDPATLRWAWTTTEDAAAARASGEVVWNTDRQVGFMRFDGLERNDPAQFQYQLWIFDRARDERHPVDGGVFDMTTEAGEIVIPIDARVPVAEPYLFAITVEPPGGVVVSTRERIALVAQAVG